MKNTNKYLIMIGMVMILAMSVFSDLYAKGKHGSLQYNSTIIARFGSSVPLPTNMDIYFSGPAERPDAVIGIIKGTAFDPNIWRPISMEAENFGKWRYMIENYNDLLMEPYWSYDMLDPDGKVFGKWISHVRRTVIEVTKDNNISVHTPNVPMRLDSGRGWR